jgi:hypothetical protein
VKVTAENLTDEQVIDVLDPNGATMKLGEITGHLEYVKEGRAYSLYRAVESALRRQAMTDHLHLRLPIVGHHTATYGTPRKPFTAPFGVPIPAALPDFGSEADLIVERQAHAATQQQLEAANAENNRLQALLAQQYSDAAREAQLWLRFERLTLALTGETCQQVLDELLERQLIAAHRTARMARAYGYVDGPDTIVVDVGGDQ